MFVNVAKTKRFRQERSDALEFAGLKFVLTPLEIRRKDKFLKKATPSEGRR